MTSKWGRHDLPEGSEVLPKGLSWGRIIVVWPVVHEWYVIVWRLFLVVGHMPERKAGRAGHRRWDGHPAASWWRWRWIRD